MAQRLVHLKVDGIFSLDFNMACVHKRKRSWDLHLLAAQNDSVLISVEEDEGCSILLLLLRPRGWPYPHRHPHSFCRIAYTFHQHNN